MTMLIYPPGSIPVYEGWWLPTKVPYSYCEVVSRKEVAAGSEIHMQEIEGRLFVSPSGDEQNKDVARTPLKVKP